MNPQPNTPSNWEKEWIITKERVKQTTASPALIPRASPAFLGSYNLAQTSVNNPSLCSFWLSLLRKRLFWSRFLTDKVLGEMK